jgi:hypothetical protein
MPEVSPIVFPNRSKHLRASTKKLGEAFGDRVDGKHPKIPSLQAFFEGMFKRRRRV